MTPQEYLHQPYSRIVIPTDTGYHAEILEFSGCVAQGNSPEAAYRNLESSAIGWIEACLEMGQEIPDPFSNVGFSGKLALRLPKSIHRQASQMAIRDGVSLNQFLVTAIACRIGAEDCYSAIANRLAKSVVQTSNTLTFNFRIDRTAVEAHSPSEWTNLLLLGQRANTSQSEVAR